MASDPAPSKTNSGSSVLKSGFGRVPFFESQRIPHKGQRIRRQTQQGFSALVEQFANPKGLRPQSPACEERATLGKERRAEKQTPTVAPRWTCTKAKPCSGFLFFLIRLPLCRESRCDSKKSHSSKTLISEHDSPEFFCYQVAGIAA